MSSLLNNVVFTTITNICNSILKDQIKQRRLQTDRPRSDVLILMFTRKITNVKYVQMFPLIPILKISVLIALAKRGYSLW